MKRWTLLVALAAACTGPPAPDAAVCEDFIHRICIAPICDTVNSTLNPGADCEQDLLARTGCSNPDFQFTTPDRARFLSCRLPLLRSGSSRDSAPNCDDVQDIFNNCGDLVIFFQTQVDAGSPTDGGP